MEIAQKTRKSRKNTEIMRNSNGILSEIARKSRKSRKITEIPRKYAGIAPNSHGIHTKITRNSEITRNSSDFAWVRALGGTRRPRVGCHLPPSQKHRNDTEFNRNSVGNRTKITKVMQNHRNYTENTRNTHRIHADFTRNSVNSHGIP